MALPPDHFDKYLTERAKTLITNAARLACSRDGDEVGSLDLLDALSRTRGVANSMLLRLDVDLRRLRSFDKPVVSAEEVTPACFGAEFNRLLLAANAEARGLNHNYIGTEHILLGLLVQKETPAAAFLNDHGVDLESARQALRDIVDPEAE